MGTFDGVHLGHQKLIRELVSRAACTDTDSVLITYNHHPLETIYRNPFPYLLTEKPQRENLLKKLGIDVLLYLNFDHQMAEMEPYDFLYEVLYKELKPLEFVIGYDTHFGRNRSGNYDFLQKFSKKLDYQVQIVEPFRLNGKIVSSSWCREYVRAGRLRQLPQLLGRAYSLTGMVVKGNALGHVLGFPTINLSWDDPNKLIPKPGIYLSKVLLPEKVHWGVTNVGFRPTVINKSDLTVETHILDFNQNIYGSQVTITFEHRIRPEFKLADKEELRKYIKKDIEVARKMISQRES